MNDNPCVICEEYNKGKTCQNRNNCPVGIMKRKYLEAKRELRELRNKNAKLENDASWDEEIRYSHPGRGFW